MLDKQEQPALDEKDRLAERVQAGLTPSGFNVNAKPEQAEKWEPVEVHHYSGGSRRS